MAEVLVLAEHSDGEVKKVTGELLTLARQFGEPAAVWVGAGARDGARPRLAEFGAAKVYVADGADFTDYVTGAGGGRAGLAGRAGLTGRGADGLHRARTRRSRAGWRSRPTPACCADAVGLAAHDGKIVAEQSVFGGATVVHSAVKTGHPDRDRAAQLGGGRARSGRAPT